MPKIRIDKEFAGLLTPQTEDERLALEADVRQHGILSPLVVWHGKSILLDGHHRYQLAQELDLSFETVSIRLPSRQAAADWVDSNQLARRNLTPDAYRYILGRRYLRQKAQWGGKRRGSTGKNCRLNGDTAQRLAQECGVSERTVRNAAQFAAYVDADPDVRQAMLDGEPVRRQRTHDEWFTPSWLLDRARKVLGRIDLDPASCVAAQETVQARRFYSARDNGLTRPWRGNVWLNPPFSDPVIREFVAKLTKEIASRRTRNAILLIPARPATAAFHEAAACSQKICLMKGRVKFVDPTGKPSSPPFTQALFYYGTAPARFARVFGDLGLILTVNR